VHAGCDTTTTTTTLYCVGTCATCDGSCLNKGDPCCVDPSSGYLFCCAGNCQYDYGTQRHLCTGCGEKPGDVCCPGNVCDDPYPCCGGYCAEAGVVCNPF
jgi:hypothetical protein